MRDSSKRELNIFTVSIAEYISFLLNVPILFDFFCYSYDAEIKKLENVDNYRSPLGIMRESELAKIKGKNIFHLSPPDLMHDIMEGILPEVCRLVLKHIDVDMNDLKKKINIHFWVNGPVRIESGFKVVGKAIQVALS